jgi:hypothetical protein
VTFNRLAVRRYTIYRLALDETPSGSSHLQSALSLRLQKRDGKSSGANSPRSRARSPSCARSANRPSRWASTPIANQLGLIPSTCLHILRVLVAEELVAFDPDNKKYTLMRACG